MGEECSSLTDQIYELLNYALYVGIEETRFWEMTLTEIIRVLEAYNKKRTDERQEKAFFDYTMAQTIASFVGIVISGKGEPPNIYDIYPTIFDKELINEQQQKRQEQQNVVNFLNMANAFNAQFNVEDKQK